MSAPAGLRETLARVGVSLVLHLKDRSEPLYGDVATSLQPDASFGFTVWGVLGTQTLSMHDVRSATSPDLGFKEYREIRRRQREAFEAERATEPRESVEPEPEPGDE